MKHSYSLKLENPCSEDWDSMQNRADGKYCPSCCKNIIDFTTLTNDEIIKVLESNNRNLCGRVRIDQLDVSLSRIERSSWTSYLNRFIAGMLFIGSAFKVNGQAYNAKNKITVSQPSRIHDVSNKKQDTLRCIKGRIINAETDSAIAGALLKIRAANISAITTSEGRFLISIPDSLMGKDVQLDISKEGYSPNQLIVKANAINEPQRIGLYEHRTVSILAGGLVTVVRPKKKWWRRLF